MMELLNDFKGQLIHFKKFRATADEWYKDPKNPFYQNVEKQQEFLEGAFEEVYKSLNRIINDGRMINYEVSDPMIIKKNWEKAHMYLVEIRNKETDQLYIEVINDYIGEIKNQISVSEEVIRPNSKKINLEPSFNLTWDGDKYELCELIQALYLSKKIRENNKPVTQKRILEVFSQLFPDEIFNSSNLSTNLKEGYNKEKRLTHNQFFLNDLESIFIKFLKELILKDSKR